MNAYILVKYLHIVSILVMVSLLVVELFLVKSQMTRADLKRISRIDALYGIAAVGVVAAGLTLWFGVGKGEAFYDNPFLYVKVTIAVIVGLISIIPTVYFIRKGKGDPAEILPVPARIKQLIILQLALLSMAPLLAVLVAQGIKP